MTIEEVIRLLVKRHVIDVSEHYEWDEETNTSTETMVVKTTGCGCCSDIADLPADVLALILEADAS